MTPWGVNDANIEVVVKIERLLICTGAPKAGTTFLYDQLKSQPNVPINFGTRKELDFFTRHRHSEKAVFMQGVLQLPRSVHRTLGWRSKANFLSYFDSPRPEHWFFDCSPGYMGLSVSTHREIRELFHATKTILCIRKPTDRVMSHLNYMLRLRRNQFSRLSLEAYYKTDKCKRSTDYSGEYARLCKVYGADKVKVVCFEDLVSPERAALVAQALGGYLGFPLTLRHSQVVNPTSYQVELPPATLQAISEFYKREEDFWSEHLIAD